MVIAVSDTGQLLPVQRPEIPRLPPNVDLGRWAYNKPGHVLPRPRPWPLIIVLPTVVSAASLADKFGAGLPSHLTNSGIPAAISGAVGRAVPVLAVSPGLRYEYDPETGAFTRSVVVGGQILMEHADTLGRSHWNVNLSYEYLQFDDVGGQPLRGLSEPRPFVAEDGTRLFTIPRLSYDVQIQQAALNVTYGVTDRLDLQVIVPLAHANLVRRETFVFFGLGPTPDEESSGTSGNATGIGDVFVRGKFALWKGESLSVSGGLGIRTPTGDAANFLGSGLTEVVPALYISSATWELPSELSLRFASNLAMAFTAEDVARSQARWGLGVDLSWAHRLYGAAALLGSDDVGPLLDESALNSLFCAANCRSASPRLVESPAFGIDGGRADGLAVSLGIRAPLWRDSLIGFANVLLPVRNQGVTTTPAPLIGAEFAF